MDANEFLNPSADYRMMPYWFWNGTIEDGEIARQVREMSDKGIGGFALSPRSGLRIPYLSNIWFERVQQAVDAADAHGLRVWIHDEFPHPGGMSAGQVTLGYPQFRAQYLTHRETTVQGGQQVDMDLPWATVLRAIAVPLRRDRSLWEDAEDIAGYIGSNHSQSIYQDPVADKRYHTKQFQTQDPVYRLFWKAPPGRWRVLVFLQKEHESPEFAGSQFDPYSRDAVAHFMETAFRPYASLPGDVFGRVVSGILTTEARPSKHRLSWSPLLPQAFENRNGYDLLKCLPALITQFGPNTARIRYDYFQTLSEMLRDSYHSVCASWCERHKVSYAADVPILRNSHRTSVHLPGSNSDGEKLGSPGGRDSGVPTAAYRQNPKFAASLAHQTGTQRVFSSGFRHAGWSLTLQDMKWTVDRLASLGSNLFNAHGFYYTLDGLRKHDAPPSLFHQNPYWKHFRLLSDYVGRLSYALSQGRHVADIALLDPVTSLWTHLAHPEHGWDYVGYDSDEQKLASRLSADWDYLMASLGQMQRDFDCLDPEMLTQASVVDGRLEVGDASYEVLVLPPLANLERDAYESVRNFINSGGKTISIGLLPVEDIEEGSSVVEAFSRLTDMEPSRMIRDYIGHELGVHSVQRGNLWLVRTGGSVAQNHGAVVLGDLLDEMLPRRVSIQSDRKAAKSLLCHLRENGDEQICFLANPTQNAFSTQIGLRAPAGGNCKVERWDLETGRRSVLPSRVSADHISVELAFEPLVSHLLVVSKGQSRVSTEPVDEELLPVDLSGNWKVDPEEDNALRLDRFRMQIDAQDRGIKQNWHKPEYSDSRWTTVEPKPFGEQIRNVPSLTNLSFHVTSDGPERPLKADLKLPVVCWFRTVFWADVVPSKLALVMDRSAILGSHQIFLNGSRLPSNAFRPTFRYDHSNVTCAVGRRATRGKNVIAIRVEIADLTEGLVDAFSLFGSFRVGRWRGNMLRLSSPIERGILNDLDAVGMPTYAGTVAYSRDVVFPKLPEGDRFQLSFGKQLKEASNIVEVLVNGHSLGVRAWAPYEWSGETSRLKPGKNRVVIRVTSTLARLLTGQEFQPRQHAMRPVKI